MLYDNNNHNYKQATKAANLQEILALVTRKTNYEPRVYGKGYLAHCPAHEDKKASFSIAQGDDGRVLVYCFSGCSFNEIHMSLNLPASAFFPPRNNRNSIYE